MVVHLTTDVAGLGLRNDQIIVKAGRMRQDLFPAGLALYTDNGRVIPNTPFGTVLPSPKQLARNAADLAARRSMPDGDPFALPVEVEEVETVVPEPLKAIPEPAPVPVRPTGPTPDDIEAQMRAAAEREMSLAESLRRVGTLLFRRRVRDPEHGLLHGSVTVDEVRRVLGESHSIVVERDRAAFKLGRGAADEDAANRVRTLGRHTLLVRLPVLEEEVPVRIDVKAEAS